MGKKTIGIIPCRYNSSRFPGKPLEKICDMPMYWHVYNQSLKSDELDDVMVATDDVRIQNSCINYDVPVIMTSDSCATGTDRVAEAADLLDCDIVVNIQGDEPMIDPVSIDLVAKEIKSRPEIFASNAYAVIDDNKSLEDNNIVKVVISSSNQALMFSRLPIPYRKNKTPVYRQQLGLYAFTRESVLEFTRLPQKEIEMSEDVEMLRVIENDLLLSMVEVLEKPISVDTPDDLDYVRSIMEM